MNFFLITEISSTKKCQILSLIVAPYGAFHVIIYYIVQKWFKRMNTQTKTQPNQVLATALINLKDLIKISSEDLGKIIGVHRNTITRFLKKGEIDVHSKEGELSLLLIRVYRSLYALNGGNIDAIRHWLFTQNRHLQGIPLDLMKTILGLSLVVNYLDAIRGKV